MVWREQEACAISFTPDVFVLKANCIVVTGPLDTLVQGAIIVGVGSARILEKRLIMFVPGECF